MDDYNGWKYDYGSSIGFMDTVAQNTGLSKSFRISTSVQWLLHQKV